jgi:hypothetical protein
MADSKGATDIAPPEKRYRVLHDQVGIFPKGSVIAHSTLVELAGGEERVHRVLDRLLRTIRHAPAIEEMAPEEPIEGTPAPLQVAGLPEGIVDKNADALQSPGATTPAPVPPADAGGKAAATAPPPSGGGGLTRA